MKLNIITILIKYLKIKYLKNKIKGRYNISLKNYQML